MINLNFNRKKLFSFVLFILASFSVFAQKNVTGKVTSSDDKATIPGVSVSIKGSTYGTVTDQDGRYSITVKEGAVLTYSYIGFLPKDVTVGAASTYDVVLKTSLNDLNDVVVTGYSKEKKKDITGSVSVVNVEQLKNIPAGSPEQALQGQASGLNIVTSGEPGGPSSIRIRGITSLGNVDPLVIIDGIQGSLRNINSTDIASIQVLKDAASAAVYGVRGSNGVIIVTTKKGKGKASITYDGYTGFQQPPSGNVFNLLNPQEMADVTWLALNNSNPKTANGNPTHPQYGNGVKPVLPDYLLIGTKNGVIGQPTQAQLDQYNIDYAKGGIYQIIPANKQGTDWFHEIFKTAPINSHTITASGGYDKSTYLYSLGVFDQQGTLNETYLKRYSLRANNTFSIKDKIRVGENAYIFYRNAAGTPQGNQNEDNPISHTYREQPIIPVYDYFGNYAGSRPGGLGNAKNPFAQTDRTKNNKNNVWDIQGNVFAEIDFLHHFTFRSSFGGSIDNQYSYGFNFQTYENNENNAANSFSENSQYNSSWTFNNTVNYAQVFGKHSVKALIGIEAVSNYGRGLGGNTQDYFTVNPDYLNLSNGSGTKTNNSYAYQDALSSSFFKADYSYADKYLVSATVRRDGSSKFGPDNRYGVFPAASVGWRVSAENFLKSATWIDNLLLKGSYGVLGSQSNINSSNAYTLYGGDATNSYYDLNGTSTSSVQGFSSARTGNKKTKWEEDKVTNIGFDATLFKSKLDVSVEYFKKSINGLLFQDQSPATFGGAALPFVNIGDVSNTGVDASVAYHGNVNEFKFDVGAIFTTYKSKVVNIPGNFFDAGVNTRVGYFVRNQVGHPIGAFYGYQVDGYFKDAADVSSSATQADAAPGRFKYADINGDKKISSDDRTFFGDPNPDFTYGLNLGANYKGFDLSAFFYGSQGNQAINFLKYYTDFYSGFIGVKGKDLLYNSWTPTRLNPKTPIAEDASNFSTNTVASSYYLEDASFLKLRSLILGYTISPEKLKRFGIDRVRVYLQGANLFTITKYSGLDPELIGAAKDTQSNDTAAFGLDFGNYPNNQRNYNLGVSLTF
ncbi:TonB-linked SusC/RagA family outer membrane protein [Pedobacter sp. UYP30]|uniref:SusC/RagA family TonB-linked outer membrane protein n=1 Tax=Pedobacter sp. UYP30 TaxID=1756400 RepID=UPI0033923A86